VLREHNIVIVSPPVISYCR